MAAQEGRPKKGGLRQAGLPVTADIPCRSRVTRIPVRPARKNRNGCMFGRPASKTDSRHGIVAAVSDP
jgi:hypothetical protein